VHVRVDSEQSSADDNETLHVVMGQGVQVMRMIQNAVEENQIQAMVRI